MTNLDIRIDIDILTHYSASLKHIVREETLLLMIHSFSKYVLELYGVLIEEAIHSNRYEGNWEPIDELGYLEYLGTTPTTPILYLLREAIIVSKESHYYIIKIDPSYQYPGSELSLVQVVRAIEEGTSEFNSRTIFKKITNDINSHILDLWRGYLLMKGVV